MAGILQIAALQFWYHVMLNVDTNLSGENVASIFRAAGTVSKVSLK